MFELNHNPIQRGLLGVASAASGIAVSFSQVEVWLRIASLCVGITVGILTIISLAKTLKK